jgi:glyoxylase-like metal-dependent hydrolase (beta-lactamase superfamily II)
MQGDAKLGDRCRIEPFFDPLTCTVSYAVWDLAARRAAFIDPVLDYDFRAGRTGTHSADRILRYLEEQALGLDWILETHAHADHLSAAQYVRERAGGCVGIGERICEVQRLFGDVYNLGDCFLPDGSQFDRLFRDGEVFRIGELQATAWFVPGHTPADMAYLVDGAAFVGDTLFMPDVGTARADFPGGSARLLYRSIRRLLDLSPDTRICVGHDYPPHGRVPHSMTTVAEQRRANIHVRDGIGEDSFVAMRDARDATLELPTLLLAALQVNVRGGRMPPPDENGVSYMRLPLNVFGSP